MMAALAKAKVNESARPRPQDADRYVGAKLRGRRLMLGMTQQQMADLIGVTYQQAHKDEKGINRIASGVPPAVLGTPDWSLSGQGRG
jgi:DNA-binding XRE family transcriptional regulator